MRLHGGILLSALILAAACTPGRTRVAPSPTAATPPAGPAGNAPAMEAVPPEPPVAGAGVKPEAGAEAGSFRDAVLPILQARCSPCHFEGGVMHSKLPFDDPRTIRALGARLFTRIRDPEDQAPIREFLRSGTPEATDRSR